MGPNRLRNLAIASFVVAICFILVGGYFAKDRVAPIPEKIVAPDGRVVTTRGEIMAGQDVFQSRGLMDHGSIWGHGSVRGLDFSAATLHEIGQAMRDWHAARAAGAAPAEGAFAKLPEDRQAHVGLDVIRELKVNRYDPNSRTLPLTAAQAYALDRMRGLWDREFRDGDKREGFLPNTVASSEDRRHIADFFFWTAWAAGTPRPGKDYTYTNNWPPDRSVGNDAHTDAVTWSIGSILAFLGVLGVIVYVVHRYQFFFGPAKAVQLSYRLLEMPVTPSQRASAKFFLVAGLLFLCQILNGGLLAHYTVDPSTFYLELVSDNMPYAVAKSWHLQLGIFWIAISWIGTAIYVAPVIGGAEPRGQKLLVNLLFVAAVVVVGGSLLGEWLSIRGHMGEAWFWLGHQGWEYLELGRAWQIALFAGMIFWLVIVYRAILRGIRGEADPEKKSLVIFYVIAAVLVVAFFGFGLMYGRGTHFTIADYWRWFVVHIWVESIFEFFGIAVVALFLVTMGLVTARSALRVAYLTAVLVFFSGIVGTAHHYFWTGGPGFWLAIGGVFSSLEPIPLILLVVRAWMEYKQIHEEGREFPYRWPLYFLTASSVWNFLGAAIFGFMINLPIINYYEHATYLTTNHAHSALFGVYGMLAVSLILFSWRGLVQKKFWNERLLKVVFWGLNGGLFLMFSTSLLPVGLTQTHLSFEKGFWFARSADFYELPIVQTLGKWRIVPDLIIIVAGALPLLYFLVRTFTKLRQQSVAADQNQQPE